MDLAAEFYLDTIDSVFIRHVLPRGRDDPARAAHNPPAADPPHWLS